jgi:hypothetical protein
MNPRSTPSGPASADAVAGTIDVPAGRAEAPSAVDSRHDTVPPAAIAAKEAP